MLYLNSRQIVFVVLSEFVLNVILLSKFVEVDVKPFSRMNYHIFGSNYHAFGSNYHTFGSRHITLSVLTITLSGLIITLSVLTITKYKKCDRIKEKISFV